MNDAGDSLFVSWIPYHQRSSDLASQLGARAEFVAMGVPLHRWTAPFRHAAQAALTIRLLRRARPAVVFVMTPPALLPLVARLAVGRRAVIVADAHSKAVMRVGSSRVRASYRVIDWCADAAIVTNAGTAGQLAGRRAPVFVADDPLPTMPAPTAGSDEPAGVVYPASWERDEPIAAVIAAAEQVPELEWWITGKPRGTPAKVPSNVRLTGYLNRDDYVKLLRRATVVLALTTRANTMQRAAYEAMVLHLPVVASDTASLRAFLGDAAVYTRPDSLHIAASVRDAVADREELVRRLRRVVGERRNEQRHAVEEIAAFTRHRLHLRHSR